jgi:hypothetical protein
MISILWRIYVLCAGLRGLASAARTISELEKLLQIPQLLEVRLVAASAGEVRALGKSVRLLAQEKLTAAVREKNQAGIASSLQVFYNLESLPEVLLLVVDSTVKRAVEASRAALDLEGLQALMLGETGPAAHIPGSASKKPAPHHAPVHGHVAHGMRIIAVVEQPALIASYPYRWRSTGQDCGERTVAHVVFGAAGVRPSDPRTAARCGQEGGPHLSRALSRGAAAAVPA